mmetsp:Transcript_42245/g.95541  ORF Transcript_42245/g.95541 Transcript_42245/m.95541 type:complete len:309 (-) Transcript_42245:490-1416(-)
MAFLVARGEELHGIAPPRREDHRGLPRLALPGPGGRGDGPGQPDSAAPRALRQGAGPARRDARGPRVHGPGQLRVAGHPRHHAPPQVPPGRRPRRQRALPRPQGQEHDPHVCRPLLHVGGGVHGWRGVRLSGRGATSPRARPHLRTPHVPSPFRPRRPPASGQDPDVAIVPERPFGGGADRHDPQDGPQGPAEGGGDHSQDKPRRCPHRRAGQARSGLARRARAVRGVLPRDAGASPHGDAAAADHRAPLHKDLHRPLARPPPRLREPNGPGRRSNGSRGPRRRTCERRAGADHGLPRRGAHRVSRPV